MPALLLLLAALLPDRVGLGQYGRWGAFRDARPPACFAIAEPSGRSEGAYRPFVAVTTWPVRRIAAQLHVRLRDARPDRIVTLRIGDRATPLLAGPADAWAHDAREDLAIVAAMRRAERLIVEVKEKNGRHHSYRYPLAGAASAIDAAAVGCLAR